MITGDAVWKTPTQPSTAESKSSSLSKSAWTNWSLSFAPSSASKCSVFLGSPEIHRQEQQNIRKLAKKNHKKCHRERKILTCVTGSGSDDIPTLEQTLYNPWSYVTRSSCYTHQLPFSTHPSLCLLSAVIAEEEPLLLLIKIWLLWIFFFSYGALNTEKNQYLLLNKLVVQS